MTIGITVDFNANIARFNTQVDRLTQRLDGFQQHSENISAKVNKALGLIGVGVSIAGITEFVKSGIDATDMLNDLSERTGIAIETLAGFDLVAKLGDTNLESFAGSINKLSINLSNNREEFAKLGITAEDPIEAFYQLADAFSAIDNEQDRAAFGAKVLGKSYAEMSVLLNQGGAALRAQVEDNKKYSGITEDSAKQTGRLNDQLDILTARMQGIQALIGGKVATSINNWIDTLSGEGIDSTIKKIIEIDADIKVQQGVIERIKKHPILAALENYDIGEEQRKLDILIERRGQAVKKRSAEAQPDAGANANPIQATNSLFLAAEQKYNLPPSLLKAVASVETGGSFKADLVSAKGAVGLMQLMPDTAKALGVTDRTDKAQSIEGGARLLRELLDRYNGNLNLAIAAYNAGPTAIDKAGGGIPNFPETQKYVPKVLEEIDRLQKNSGDNTLVGQLKLFTGKFSSLQEAAAISRKSDIDTRLKVSETAAGSNIEALKILKEEGKLGIADYYQALTQQQRIIVNANIDAVNARMAEIERQRADAQVIAKPEDLPKINAQFAAQKAELETELQSLQAKLSNIEPANLIDRDKEQKALDDVVTQVKLKLAELRGETANDPIAIKARLELENANIIDKLKQAGQSGLADQYVNALSATEQAGIIETNIGRAQQRSQAKETRINLLQQSGSITQFRAQQELRQLYKDSADELDKMAEKLASLGDSTGLEELKLKALDAKNAAGQLRVTLPDLNKQIIDGGQNAAIASMTDGLIGLSNGAESAGQAFTNMGLSITKAIQQIAAEQLAKQIIGTVINLAGSAFSGSVTGGGTDAGINTSNTGISSSIDAFLPRAGGGYIQGPGTETSDSIRTTLPAGSFVIKAASVKKFGLPALARLTQGATDNAGADQVPVRLSNREFAVLPSMVAKYGRNFWQHLNDIGSFPPMSIQRAYAGGGLVGGASASSSVVQPGAGDAITVNVPVTINQPENKGGPDNGKLDPAAINALGKRFKAIVAEEIAQQQRPGGLLYGRH